MLRYPCKDKKKAPKKGKDSRRYGGNSALTSQRAKIGKGPLRRAYKRRGPFFGELYIFEG